MSNIVHLVDGSGYIFRAYYAIQHLSNSKGFPTNALFGFVRMLLKLLNDAESDHVIVTFDAGRATFRTEIYPEYKANREACPDDLVLQMPYFRKICSALGLVVLEKPGYEADDLIGTLARRYCEAGYKTVIVSGDKDLMQLVNDDVMVWDTMKDRRYCAADVVEKFGVEPEKVVEILALVGDSSDNIPGVKGVGPKTAAQLISRFGTAEGVIASVDALRQDAAIRNRVKIAEQIQLSAETIMLSKKLALIDRYAPITLAAGDVGNDKPLELEGLSDSRLLELANRKSLNERELQRLSDELEFSSLLKEIGIERSELVDQSSKYSYLTVFEKDFDRFANDLRGQSSFAFDIETDSLNVREANLVGASFCWSDERAFYIPIGHKNCPDGVKQVSQEQFLDLCREVFADPLKIVFGQNLKFDLGLLLERDLVCKTQIFDTMVAAYLLNPDRRGYSLSSLARNLLGMRVTEFEDVARGLDDFSCVEIPAAAHYGAEDAHVAWLLAQKLQGKLTDHKLQDLASDIEMPLVLVLACMEKQGVLIDVELLNAMSAKLEVGLKKLEQEIYRISGVSFNVNSPRQLADVLFNKLNISPQGISKTKTGLSTNFAALEILKTRHPLPEFVLRYRNLHKLKSTYVDTLPRQVSKKSGRLHSSFNQTITGTGRLSSSDPNLQNIPIRTEEGRAIRAAFIAAPGKLLISADYSQIELRILAHMSQDKNLIEAFVKETDIHTKTAREIFGLSALEEVSAEQRRIGKTINFGIIYGMGPHRLARELGVSFKEADSYIESYFDRYPLVKNFFDKIAAEAEETGAVYTIFGRRRLIEDIESGERDKGFVMRAALNAPIQGSAADLIKLAMVRIDSKIKSLEIPLKLLLQIHDELVFECDEDRLQEASAFIVSEMEGVARLAVPLKVELGSGRNWEAAH
jgi:DNA polymerase-1